VPMRTILHAEVCRPGNAHVAFVRCREQDAEAYNNAVSGFKKEISGQLTVKHAVGLLIRSALLVLTWLLWVWVLNQPLSNIQNLSVIVGGVLMAFPVVWAGRRVLDKQPAKDRAVWVTAFVHFALGT
jgi:hypothetical protein